MTTSMTIYDKKETYRINETNTFEYTGTGITDLDILKSYPEDASKILHIIPSV